MAALREIFGRCPIPAKTWKLVEDMFLRLVRRTVSRDKEHSLATKEEKIEVACVARTRKIGQFFAVAIELEELVVLF